MLYKEYQPRDQLGRYIKCFWRLEHDYSKEPFKAGERLWPDGHFELIFTYGKNYKQKVDSAWIALSKHFLIGQFNRELQLNSNGTTGLHGVRFYAWGLYPLLKTSMNIYTNKITDALAVFGNNLKDIEKCLTKGTEESRIEVLQNFFADSLCGINHQSVVAPIAEEIYEKRGVVQISELTDKYRINPRKLQRLFEVEVGLSAKHFAKIVRFNHAKNIIQRDVDINLARVAYSCGYADQSHFIKNFKALYGITPTQFREKIIQFKTCLQKKRNHVVFVQDNDDIRS